MFPCQFRTQTYAVRHLATWLNGLVLRLQMPMLSIPSFHTHSPLPLVLPRYPYQLEYEIKDLLPRNAHHNQIGWKLRMWTLMVRWFLSMTKATHCVRLLPRMPYI